MTLFLFIIETFCIKVDMEVSLDATVDRFKAQIAIMGMGYTMKDWSDMPLAGTAAVHLEYEIVSEEPHILW